MTNKEIITQAFVQLYPQLAALARGFHRGDIAQAEDSLQQAFITLSKIKDSVDIINSKELIKTALFNQCIRAYHSNRKQSERIVYVGASNVQDEPYIFDPSEQEETAIRQLRIAEFANTLKKKQRNVFLSLIEGMSIIDIAKATGNSYNTIKHNRRLVVEKLVTFFKERNEEFNYDRIKVSNEVFRAV